MAQKVESGQKSIARKIFNSENFYVGEFGLTAIEA